MLIKSIIGILVLLSLFGASCTKGEKEARERPSEQKVPSSVSDREAPAPDEAHVSEGLGEGNRPPEITEAKMVADIEQDRNVLRAEATAVDEDGDEIVLDYQWEKNGRIVEEKGDVLRDFKRGDWIVLIIRPYDGKEYGNGSIMRTEITNTAPTIIRDDGFSFDGAIFTKQIRAEDADGDQLVFALVKGPEGMTVDPSSGELSWTVPPDLTGIFSARVEVSDGHGGTVSYDIEVPITVEEEKKPE